MNISNNNISGNNNKDDICNNNNGNYSISCNIATSNTTTEPVRLESILKLLDMLRFHIDFDIHSLLYIILKEVNSDVKEAYKRIVEGELFYLVYYCCYLK